MPTVRVESHNIYNLLAYLHSRKSKTLHLCHSLITLQTNLNYWAPWIRWFWTTRASLTWHLLKSRSMIQLWLILEHCKMQSLNSNKSRKVLWIRSVKNVKSFTVIMEKPATGEETILIPRRRVLCQQGQIWTNMPCLMKVKPVTQEGSLWSKISHHRIRKLLMTTTSNQSWRPRTLKASARSVTNKNLPIFKN